MCNVYYKQMLCFTLGDIGKSKQTTDALHVKVQYVLYKLYVDTATGLWMDRFQINSKEAMFSVCRNWTSVGKVR